MSKDASHSTPESITCVDPATLPDDLATCHQLIRNLLDAIKKETFLNQHLQHQLETLLRARYGKKSEKLDPNQLLLFAEEMLNGGAEPPKPEPTPEPKPRKQRSKTGRRPFSKDLPRERVVHDLPENQKPCPCCGKMRKLIGEETSDQLGYRPAALFIIEHARLKFGCEICDGEITTAPKPPQPIEKGLAAPSLLAHVITSKYGDHLPLYRLEGIFGRHGAEISRKTMCGWMADCATQLAPIILRMAQRIKRSRAIHTDATTLPVQAKGKTRTAYLSPYIGDGDHPLTVFDFTETYKRDGPMKFLEGYQGYLQADAHSTYNELYKSGTIIEVACWAHARRKFFDAKTTEPALAHIMLAMIGELYKVEREATEHINKSIAEAAETGVDVAAARTLAYAKRHELRQTRSVPMLDKIKTWLDEGEKKALPKSPIGQAIGYLLNHWPAFRRYTEQGYLAIDNNIAERAIKNVVIGRKGWMFAGSDEGGNTAAILFSLTVTCKTLSIDPFAYLSDVLTRLPVLAAKVKGTAALVSHPELDDLLPDRWKALRDQPTVSPAES